MHCILCVVSHTCTFAIDHAELELKEPTEQAQVEYFTNIDLGSRQASVHPIKVLILYIINFIYNTI
jgi:hypothetical protein